MTCKEFQSKFGISTRAHVLTGSDVFSRHMSTCADCRHFFEMQQEVGRQLRVVSDSVPQVSAAFDARVFASYRDFVAARANVSGSISFRERIAPLALSWRGAVAVGVLAAVILTLTLGRDVNKTNPSRATESAAVPQLPNQRITTAAIPENTQSRTHYARAHHTKRKSSAGSVVSASSSLPVGFRSLMYCDQLSCADAMEIVRVQLPTSIVRLTPGVTGTGDIVFADVLVGPDGIARGIRIVE